MTSLILLSDWQKSQIEFWRVIPGMPEHDVSNFGRVRSWRFYDGHRRRKPKILKPSIHRQGYRYVEPQYNGQKTYGFIHRLVALAFIANPNGLPEVNHLSGLKSDNRDGNLEWSTRFQNQRHAWDSGLMPVRRLSEEQVRDIRRRKHENHRLLAAEMNVSRTLISRIARNEGYADVA